MSFSFQKKAAASEAVALFRECLVPAEKPRLTRMMGNPDADILVIAPPCNAVEYEHNLPFCKEQARMVAEIFLNAGFNIVEQTLVVSCSQYGAVSKRTKEIKASKASTEPVKKFIELCGKRKLFKLYLCFGSDAFKFIFGGGKKPSTATMLGSVMYVEETNHAPLMFMPDIDPLLYEETDSDRENYFRRKAADQLANNFEVLAENFVKHYESL